MNARLLALALCLVSIPCAAAAQSTDPLGPSAPVVETDARARMRRALLAVEGEAPASFFAAQGTAGRDALLSMLSDASEALLFRRRAAIALRHYPEPTVRAALEARAIDEREDAIVSRYALRTLGIAFGASAFEGIAARLDDPRAYVREGAALSLRAIDPRRAAPLLRARRAIEPEAFVRTALE